MRIVQSEKDQELKESVVKRCRRCIQIYNNDDFYLFFNTVEEETSLLFGMLIN